MGPVGDGLITLMDQKLSKLDDRLYDLSSKINSAKISVPEPKTVLEPEIAKPSVKPEEKKQIPPTEKKSFIFDKPKPTKTEPVVIPPTKTRQSFELTTLTRISKEEPKFEIFEKQIPTKQEIVKEVKKPEVQIKNKIKNTTTQQVLEFEEKPDLDKEVQKITQFKALPEPKLESQNSSVNLEDDFDDDSDDIDKIKGEILNVLSKLDQAEVE